MSQSTPFQWFLQKLTRDLFFFSVFSWLLLFLLETLKSGLVSHYLSLPHLAFFVFVLGIIALSLRPQGQLSDFPKEEGITKKNALLLSILSVLAAFFLLVFTDLSLILTLLLIFVTVLALWAGALILTDSD